jgi:hypothetical protein
LFDTATNSTNSTVSHDKNLSLLGGTHYIYIIYSVTRLIIIVGERTLMIQSNSNSSIQRNVKKKYLIK